MICLVTVSALTVAGTYLWWEKWPIYTSEAMVSIVLQQETVLSGTAVNPNERVQERYKRSLSAFVKTREVLVEALSDPNVMRTTWYKRLGTTDLDEIRTELENELKVVLMPDSEIIALRLGFSAPSAQQRGELPTILNAVAFAFVEYVNEKVLASRNRQITQLDEIWRRDNSRLDEIARDIAEKLLRSSVPAIRDRFNATSAELQALTKQLTDLEISRAQAETQLQAVDQQRASGILRASPQVLAILDLDPTLRAMIAQRLSLITQKEDAVTRYGLSSRIVRSLQTNLDTINRLTSEREDELIDKQVEVIVQGSITQRDMIVAMYTSVNERRQGLIAEQKDMDIVINEINTLELERKEVTRRLQTIGPRLEDLRVVSLSRPPATLFASAQVPIERSWPKWELMIPLGVVVGLLLGFGLALMLELVDTSIKTTTDITRRVDLPVLTLVPHASDLDEDIPDISLATLTSPHSLVSEAYRDLRSNLLFSGPASQRRSVLITSPSPEDGRTMTAANLAIAMAKNGQRVLLVDANFRRAHLHELFREAEGPGLSSALSGQSPWRESVQPTSVDNLSVINAGQLPPNPAELLGSELTRKVIAEMTGDYDQVIIDGPPLLLVADGAVLASMVDAVVLVVRAGVNTAGIVQRSRDTLARIGAHTLGVVLNGVRATAGGYLRQNYDAYYDYQPE